MPNGQVNTKCRQTENASGTSDESCREFRSGVIALAFSQLVLSNWGRKLKLQCSRDQTFPAGVIGIVSSGQSLLFQVLEDGVRCCIPGFFPSTTHSNECLHRESLRYRPNAQKLKVFDSELFLQLPGQIFRTMECFASRGVFKDVQKIESMWV